MKEIRKVNIIYDEETLREQLKAENKVFNNSSINITLYLLLGVLSIGGGLPLFIVSMEKGEGINFYGAVLILFSMLCLYIHLTSTNRKIKNFLSK